MRSRSWFRRLFPSSLHMVIGRRVVRQYYTHISFHSISDTAYGLRAASFLHVRIIERAKLRAIFTYHVNRREDDRHDNEKTSIA